MLALRRKEGEEIVLTIPSSMDAHEVVLLIESIRGSNVHVGVTAAPHITIHRREIHDEIQAEAALVAGGLS